MCVTKGRDILRNKAYEPNKKNGYTWQPAPQDERQLYIKGCSCGWCYECRQKNANQWRVRLKEEVKGNQFKNMIFITFTFSEEAYSRLAKEVRSSNLVVLKPVAPFTNIATSKGERSAKISCKSCSVAIYLIF